MTKIKCHFLKYLSLVLAFIFLQNSLHMSFATRQNFYPKFSHLSMEASEIKLFDYATLQGVQYIRFILKPNQYQYTFYLRFSLVQQPLWA
jgi:hypothetical protein